jgi:acylpyruvate hydrolase
MKLATIRTAAGTLAVRQASAGFVSTGFADVGALLASGSAGDGEPGAAGDFAPLVTAPGKIFCVGLNYRTHIQEMGRDLPSHPTLFAKFADALIGARDDIVLASESSAVDWEAGLGAHVEVECIATYRH